MSKWVSAAALTFAAVVAMAEDKPWSKFGRTPSEAEIAAWDIDVRPDGTGLPKGKGTVMEGQDLYDAQCAACHGTFGDSNLNLQLAGGVGTLTSDAPVRTTGSKLNYATTLWDYIYRTMPFQAPKSLPADQVYALTAYLLHLNDILPAQAALNEKSLPRVRMPNMDGFTQDHGFKTKDGNPDVRAQACMSNCSTEAKITSEMPGYAKSAHGELSSQVRTVGPYRGVKVIAPPR